MAFTHNIHHIYGCTINSTTRADHVVRVLYTASGLTEQSISTYTIVTAAALATLLPHKSKLCNDCDVTCTALQQKFKIPTKHVHSRCFAVALKLDPFYMHFLCPYKLKKSLHLPSFEALQCLKMKGADNCCQ